MLRLLRDIRGATSIEYGLIAALIVIGLVFVLPSIGQSLRSISVTAREGMKGKTCEGDPTANGIQCH